MNPIRYLLTGRVPKGEPGYMADQKKRRAWLTGVLFFVPLLIFFTMWIYLGSRKTIWTVLAILGCLPACKQLVGLIMVIPRKGIDPGLFARLKDHEGRLVAAYELYMTFYEKSAAIDALAVCGRTVVLFSTDKDIDKAYMASHAREILQGNGYRADVHVFTREKEYLERLDALNAGYESFHQIEERKDSRYEGMSRDEVVREILLALCL